MMLILDTEAVGGQLFILKDDTEDLCQKFQRYHSELVDSKPIGSEQYSLNPRISFKVSSHQLSLTGKRWTQVSIH